MCMWVMLAGMFLNLYVSLHGIRLTLQMQSESRGRRTLVVYFYLHYLYLNCSWVEARESSVGDRELPTRI